LFSLPGFGLESVDNRADFRNKTAIAIR